MRPNKTLANVYPKDDSLGESYIRGIFPVKITNSKQVLETQEHPGLKGKDLEQEPLAHDLPVSRAGQTKGPCRVSLTL